MEGNSWRPRCPSCSFAESELEFLEPKQLKQRPETTRRLAPISSWHAILPVTTVAQPPRVWPRSPRGLKEQQVLAWGEPGCLKRRRPATGTPFGLNRRGRPSRLG